MILKKEHKVGTVEVKFLVRINENGKLGKLKSIKIFSVVNEDFKFSVKKLSILKICF